MRVSVYVNVYGGRCACASVRVSKSEWECTGGSVHVSIVCVCVHG